MAVYVPPETRIHHYNPPKLVPIDRIRPNDIVDLSGSEGFVIVEIVDSSHPRDIKVWFVNRVHPMTWSRDQSVAIWRNLTYP